MSTTESLPIFRYHPDPVATGAVQASDARCECCAQSRGFVYAGAVYAENDVDQVCPWCIANGSAAAKFDASFADPHSLAKAGISREVIDEVTRRTPGYESWQGESWLAHCDDACEFHGDASADDVLDATPETKELWMAEYDLGEEDWLDVTDGYTPGSDSALYKFVCRHCGVVLFGWDCS
jgi:uncharacterized protein CbrC (UPF0167 family)